MGAPAGNQFWKNRSKHGRDKLFESPELLWEAAKEYFEWCDENPWYRSEQSKGVAKPFKDDDGNVSWPTNIAELPTARPYTLHGLCIYLDVNTAYLRQFKKTCSEDFSTVITRIEEIIYNQKFEGATVGAFNANIIARDLGLSDNSRVEHANDKDSPLIDYSKVSTEALLELINASKKSKD